MMPRKTIVWREPNLRSLSSKAALISILEAAKMPKSMLIKMAVRKNSTTSAFTAA